MTALLIIGIIIIFIGILLCLPVFIVVTYDGDDIQIIIKYLFFFSHNSSIIKKKKRKHKKNKHERNEKEKKQEKQDDPISEIIGEKGIWGTAGYLYSVVKALLNFAGSAAKRLYITHFYADVKVTGQDVAETAINYGKICSVFYPACSFVLKTFPHNKKITASAYPDFNSDKSTVDVKIIFSIAAFRFVHHVIKSFSEIIMEQVNDIIKEKNSTN